jgi:hypothetical protein
MRLSSQGEAFDRAGGLSGRLLDTGEFLGLRRFNAGGHLALLWGSPSWLQPAFSRLARRPTSFSGFPSRFLQDITPEPRCDRKCSGFASRLKGGCRHDCLPHCTP